MKDREFVKRHREGKFPEKLCGCPQQCGKPLEPRVDGIRNTIDGKEVNDDCYFANMSEIVERHPIRRIGRT